MLLPRILSAVVGIPLGILIVWVGGPWLAGLVLLLALIGFQEYHRTLRGKHIEALREIGYPAIVALIVGAYSLAGNDTQWLLYLEGVLALTVIGSLAFHIFVPVEGSKLMSAAATVLGVLYIGYLFSIFILVREMPNVPTGEPGSMPLGLRLFITILAATWAADTGAYAAGKTMGKHKLCPRVSPGKTVEGVAGGVVLAALIAWAVGSRWAGFEPGWAVGLGVVAALLGLIGDLSKSIIKRDMGVKDFGTLIPGHGGVLDRFDSLLVNMAAAYFLAKVLLA